jgi:hypothetical protein
MRNQRRHQPPWLRQLPPEHPQMLDWRVAELEEGHEVHEERLSALEQARTTLASLPWAQLLPIIAMLIGGLLLNLKPDEVAAIIHGR